ncbi:MAG TPA: endonuclease/exonuclease/phosphatase family protein, partial [Kofleriaceae bacterium]|nr:endonuclease/exonuclease/phosphatase family protein [Kofleriaceae bacterium]
MKNAEPMPSRAQRRLRVMTYNIRHARGTDNRVDIGRIAGVIESFEPDVVALQEVDCGQIRSRSVDQASELGARLGMEASFASCVEQAGGRTGIATLTRLPLVATEQVELPWREGMRRSEPRRALLTRVTWTGPAPRPDEDVEELELVNTHLSVRRGERPAQVAAIASALGTRPAVIAGDFNCTARSGPFRALCCGLRSAAPGARSWPSRFPIVQIDHILYRDLDLVSAGAWTRGGARRASDHLPVVAEFAR